MKATVTTLRMTDKESTTENKQSVFRSSLNRRAVVHSADEMHSLFMNDSVHLTFHPCFTELHRRMFLLAKHTTTETTW